jgi:hypothetical protein
MPDDVNDAIDLGQDLVAALPVPGADDPHALTPHLDAVPCTISTARGHLHH